MQFVVVTGLSGSGKSYAARVFEDMGFFCIDNMPPMLIPKFVEMFSASSKFEKVAVVVDIRVGDMLVQLMDELHILIENGYDYSLLFIDADDKSLVKRYKETRRTHPIASNLGLLDSIAKERRLLAKLYSEADHVIDTSNLKVSELSQKIRELYTENDESGISVNVTSFGFKYGMPLDADLVFDVRCFPNPFYVDDLKELTGNDKPVQDYVMCFTDAQVFLDKLYDMMIFMLPLYNEEGKRSITIAIGCTGGKHRSVTIANKLAERIKESGYSVSTNHRDVGKGR